MRTLSLNDEHLKRLEALMKKFMGVTFVFIPQHDHELVHWEDGEVKHDHNWLYITMVILPQYIGDWHLDANWMVTHMTAKKFKHPIDYLYEKYIEK